MNAAENTPGGVGREWFLTWSVVLLSALSSANSQEVKRMTGSWALVRETDPIDDTRSAMAGRFSENTTRTQRLC